MDDIVRDILANVLRTERGYSSKIVEALLGKSLDTFSPITLAKLVELMAERIRELETVLGYQMNLNRECQPTGCGTWLSIDSSEVQCGEPTYCSAACSSPPPTSEQEGGGRVLGEFSPAHDLLPTTEQEDKPERMVAVCGSCFRACCLQGDYPCTHWSHPGAVKRSLSELQRMALESPDYWKDS